jgi:hypothetical protein
MKDYADKIYQEHKGNSSKNNIKSAKDQAVLQDGYFAINELNGCTS